VAGNRHRDRSGRGADLRFQLITRVVLLFLTAWLGIAFWNTVKPLPPGTRAMSLPARLPESDVEFLSGPTHQAVLGRALKLVEHAEQLIVIDQSPLPREISQALLLRRHAKPHLKVVVIVDPAPPAFGGTAPKDLQLLEAQGIIVARVRLERLRDPNPLYGALWRLSFAWWSNPYDEALNPTGFAARARQLNFKVDRRQILVADDGAGGWASLTGSADSGSALMVRGSTAEDMLAAELALASWSDEDRLPGVPPAHGRGFGTVDARFLTEGAIGSAVVDSLEALQRGDALSLATPQLGDRKVMTALRRAAARGVKIQLLLDAAPGPNLASAGELRRDAPAIEIRWGVDVEQPPGPRGSFLLMRHATDVSIYFGTARLTRRSLGDFNLESVMELRAPVSAALPKSCADYFAKRWARSLDYARYTDESDITYWSYRIAEATGLSSF
jgi:hypothetical protein